VILVEKGLDGVGGFDGVLAVGCNIKMALPVCVSAKANFYIYFARIAVTSTQRCVLRGFLLLKHQQTHEYGHVKCTLFFFAISG
jgi:hypothetical protein